MTLHPLFAGFKGKDWSAVGDALGFTVQVTTFRAPSTWRAAPNLSGLIDPRFAEAGFLFAGWWSAPGVHCLMYVKPRDATALAWWLIGLGERAQEKQGGLRASDFYSGASVLQDLETGAYIASGDTLEGWPQVTPDQSALFVEAFALLVDGFASHTDNELPRRRLECEA